MGFASLGGFAAAVSLSTVALGAASINIDFNRGGATDQSPAATALAGPAATSGWYNLLDLDSPPNVFTDHPFGDPGSPAALYDNTNSATGATIGFNNHGLPTLNGSSTYSPNYGASGAADPGLTADQQLYNGAAHADSGAYTQQVTISNIPYARYDVYVLVVAATGHADYPHEGRAVVELWLGNHATNATFDSAYHLASNGNTGAVLPAGFSYVQATSTDPNEPTIGANYVLFSGLTSDHITIDVWSPGRPTNSGAFFGGLQIVEVPEPAALGLIGLLLVPMTARRRHV